jgi:hypothetical protein
MKKFSETMIERMKASFIPQVDDKARLAMDGTVCVRTNTANGKEWLGVKGNEIVAYPEDLLLEDVPVFTIAKTINQVKIGDIVKATSSTYARVEKIKDGQIYSTSFGGNMRKNVPVTDFLTQQKTVRVVVNPFGAAGGADMNNNVMLMMLLDNKEEKDGDLAELMMLGSMLSGQGVANPFDNIMNNPMALIAFAGKSGSSMKDIMMLNMLRQGGLMNPIKVEEVKEEAKEEIIFIPEEKIEE